MNGQFIKVPYQLLQLEIPNNCKWVYMALMRFRSGNNREIKVTLKKLSEIAGMKQRQLSSHLGKLCDAGIISRNQPSYGAGKFGCNRYTIRCDEDKFAMIPWEIAFSKQITSNSKIAYCILKQNSDLKKDSYASYLKKKELANSIQCTCNHVDKIKRDLKQAGYIDYEYDSKKIVLSYEQHAAMNNGPHLQI